jgi:EAL domain-containing protein (putative c-di-GMP-specific phosphodiesterase class I)
MALIQTIAMALRRAGERARGTASSGDIRRLGGLLLASAIFAAVYLVVRATGGTPNPLVHFAYLGIIVAAVAAGPAGGAAGGLLAGLLLGPLMPDSTAASRTFLGEWGWLFRLGAYVSAGLLVAGAWRWAEGLGRIDTRRREAREALNLAAGEPTSLAACERLLGELARLRPILAAAIYVLEPDGAYLLAGWSAPGLEINRRGYQTGAAADRLREQSQGLPRRRPFEPIVLPASAGDRIMARGGRSELVVPLQVDGEAIGVLFAIETGPPDPLDADLFHGLLELGNGAVALVRRAQRDEHAAAQRAGDLVRGVLEQPARLTPVFQPILSLSGGATAGYEALARFAGDPPNLWFERAAMAGLGAELQALAIGRARELAAQARLPTGCFLSVNVSPGLLGDDLVRAALIGELDRLVIEMTEEEAIRDYATLRAVMTEYRARGARFAIDDAGAGYASMRHVTELRPDFVKLDARLITGIGGDDARQALVRAMQSFTVDIGATLIAEGVETDAELALLASTGMPLLAQGFGIARPAAPWAATRPSVQAVLARSLARAGRQSPTAVGRSGPRPRRPELFLDKPS